MTTERSVEEMVLAAHDDIWIATTDKAWTVEQVRDVRLALEALVREVLEMAIDLGNHCAAEHRCWNMDVEAVGIEYLIDRISQLLPTPDSEKQP